MDGKFSKDRPIKTHYPISQSRENIGTYNRDWSDQQQESLSIDCMT